jgi:hypothetical protein
MDGVVFVQIPMSEPVSEFYQARTGVDAFMHADFRTPNKAASRLFL